MVFAELVGFYARVFRDIVFTTSRCDGGASFKRGGKGVWVGFVFLLVEETERRIENPQSANIAAARGNARTRHFDFDTRDWLDTILDTQYSILQPHTGPARKREKSSRFDAGLNECVYAIVHER